MTQIAEGIDRRRILSPGDARTVVEACSSISAGPAIVVAGQQRRRAGRSAYRRSRRGEIDALRLPRERAAVGVAAAALGDRSRCGGLRHHAR